MCNNLKSGEHSIFMSINLKQGFSLLPLKCHWRTDAVSNVVPLFRVLWITFFEVFQVSIIITFIFVVNNTTKFKHVHLKQGLEPFATGK